MSDTKINNGGQEWPRRYTLDELEAIAKPLSKKIGCVSLERLQRAVEGYQWAGVAEEQIFDCTTRKGQRKQLNRIIELLCKQAPDEEIQIELDSLAAPMSQRLRVASLAKRKQLARAVRRLRDDLPDSGPDPKRARLQFIGDLWSVFYCATGKRPGRVVHVDVGGDFVKFVEAALRPFDETLIMSKGWQEDIKQAIKRRNTAQEERKRARKRSRKKT
jgi:hypothetical protein